MVVFEEEGIRVICACAPQVGRSECEKDQFYNDMASEWDLHNHWSGGLQQTCWETDLWF